MNGIIRVFPHRTKWTPTDSYAFVGMPPMADFIPEHREVHISCTFTWDRKLCEDMAFHWEGVTNKPVRLGGPGFDTCPGEHVPGMYIKPNVIFTTRGCNNNCPWCMVPRVEGPLREIHINPGNVIQDNNFLQASRTHKEKVFSMLRTQKQICFKGGLEAGLVDDHFVDLLNSLYYIHAKKKVIRIAELWLACDTDGSLRAFKKACSKLVEAGFSQDKIRCYVLIGDDMEKNEARLQEVYRAGAMPFAQLRQDFGDEKQTYDQDWKKFHRMWSRPAATVAHMEQGTHYRDFHT